MRYVAALGAGALSIGLLAQPSTNAQQGPPPGVPGAAVVAAVKHDRSPALRDIQPRIEVVPSARVVRAPFPIRRGPGKAPGFKDPVLQETPAATTMPGTDQNWEGVPNVNGAHPPDTNGDVGPNHYVQWVNLSFAVYDKAGRLLYGPANGNTIFEGFFGACETTNDGDPIVLYDEHADRWVMTQFALPNYPSGPFYQCIAVSATPDPLGAWHRYQFQFSKMNDYPKFGVWADGYYMAINQFSARTGRWAGQGVAAFERSQMLAGQAARMIYFDMAADDSLGGMLPSDLDGTLPPTGAPNVFMQFDDSPDQLQLWEFHADWTNTGSSTFTKKSSLAAAAFDPNMCGYSRACIPQPGTTAKLDAISDRLMYRLQYRSFAPSHESWVVNHTVDVNAADRAGVRWYEIRKVGSVYSIYQQGTYSPTATNRWMASAAMDAAGNIAIAYNTSDASSYPSIKYAGRLATDPIGEMTQGEQDMVIGTGYQTSTYSRWGDYSMLSVDPTDGCTFWATLEYQAVSGYAPWKTRVASFKFPNCGSTPPPPPPAPAAPSGLGATAVSAAQINLWWTDNSSDESGFKIERCTGAGCGTFSQIATVAAGVTTYSNVGLAASATYGYRVRAYNAGGDSGYSNTATATTPAAPVTPPAAPSGLKAQAQPKGRIKLTWVDNSNDETSFEIVRTPAKTMTAAADATSLTDTGLTKGISYTYQVRACKPTALCSAWSNTATAVAK